MTDLEKIFSDLKSLMSEKQKMERVESGLRIVRLLETETGHLCDCDPSPLIGDEPNTQTCDLCAGLGKIRSVLRAEGSRAVEQYQELREVETQIECRIVDEERKSK